MSGILAMAAKAAHVGDVDNDMCIQDVKDGWRVVSRLLLSHPQRGVPRGGPPVRPSHQHGRQEHEFSVWLESLLEISQDGIFVV